MYAREGTTRLLTFGTRATHSDTDQRYKTPAPECMVQSKTCRPKHTNSKPKRHPVSSDYHYKISLRFRLHWRVFSDLFETLDLKQLHVIGFVLSSSEASKPQQHNTMLRVRLTLLLKDHYIYTAARFPKPGSYQGIFVGEIISFTTIRIKKENWMWRINPGAFPGDVGVTHGTPVHNHCIFHTQGQMTISLWFFFFAVLLFWTIQWRF